MSINDKIKQVLTIKNLSPSYLADDIGVQRSSISHILSGRNRPSLDIIQKIVRRFPEFTYDWFLDSDIQLSTDDSVTAPIQMISQRPVSASIKPTNIQKTQQSSIESPLDSAPKEETETIVPKQVGTTKQIIDRILIFYTDGTFREYTPA